MLTKIFINNKAYEVELLQAQQVIENIKATFIGSDSCDELSRANKLDKVVLQYIDNYEKVEYQNKEYFILKSNIPIVFKQKSFTKKYISSSAMVFCSLISLAFPVMFIATTTFELVCNIKNKIKSSFGSTKINANYRNRELIVLYMIVLLLNFGFWSWFVSGVKNETHPLWLIFVVQSVNFLLAVLNPFNFHYNKIENYNLAPYTFDSKYEQLSNDPLQRLQHMKIEPDKKKIDFDFIEQTKEKEKGRNYASY